jgi:hypothetical protein
MYRKILFGILAACLSLSGTMVVASSANAAPVAGQVIYDSTTSPLPGNLVSEAYEATSASQIGNEVSFAPGSRTLQQVTVTLSSWGCQQGSWTGGCVTTPGSTFAEPITFNIFNVGANNSVGSLIASVTQTFNIPYRPSASPTQCPSTPTTWYDATDGQCYNGLATNVTFNFSGVTLPSSVIYGVALNTSDYGASPYGDNTACHATSAGCGYDSLNIGLSIANGPTVGTDPLPGTVYQSSTSAGIYCDGGAAGTGTFRLDSPSTAPCWGTDPSNNYSEAPWYIPAVQFVAAPQSQSITFTSSAPAHAYLGGPTYTISATATSGLPVIYGSASQSTCTVSGSTVSFVGTGICNIVAFQLGNASYAAATPIVQTFNVSAIPQTLAFTSSPPSNAFQGGPTYTISATATSGLPVIYGSASQSTCTVSSSTVNFVGTGICNIVAFQLGNASYAAATPIVQTFNVLPQAAPSFAGNATSGSATWLQRFSTTITASGRPTPTLAVTSFLPFGLSVTANANGSLTISGTPLVPGIYQINVQAKNAASSTPVNFTYTLIINI